MSVGNLRTSNALFASPLSLISFLLENSKMDDSVESPLLEAHHKQSLSKKTWEEIKKIARISLPSMMFRVTSFGVLIVTQSFIGHVSSTDLAAYALVQTISMRFINGILQGMSSATETLSGQAFGAKHYHMMGIYLQRSWIVDFVTATVLLPVLIFATPIFKLLGEEDDIAEAARTISLWFIPFAYSLVFSLTIQMFLQAQMKNMIIGWLSLGVFLVHLFLSWLFVYELNFGISGAMGALIISQWGLVSGEWVYIFGDWCKETWRGFSKLALADLIPVIKLSISSGLMLCLEVWYTSILVLIAGYSDNAVVEISAFSICLNLYAWEFMIALGFLAAACVRVSNELGRGNIEAAKFSIKVLLCMTGALALIFCILFLVFGNLYPYLFTSDVEVAEAASNLFVLLALTILICNFQAIFSGVAVGIGSQAKVAIVNILSYYVVGIPIGCLLAFVAKLGIKGIWIGMLLGMIVQLTTLAILTWRIDWKEEVNKTRRRLGQFFHESPGESNQSSDHA